MAAGVLATATAVVLVMAFVLHGPTFLAPGPLSSPHASIETCSSCHTASGGGALTWLAGLAPRDPHADSKACLTCHKVPEPTFTAHGASEAVLEASTRRLTEVAQRTPAPLSARLQNAAFPTEPMVSQGLACATCHREHTGVTGGLHDTTDAQCRSCHVVKFDSFDGGHPTFDGYPFERRTRIIYDHAGHFGKHFPEVARKDPSKSIPTTCATCHDSGADRRVMGVVSFDRTCASCHLDQITGQQRVSGPKGVALLTLPGLDLPTLTKKRAAIGEWPTDSEAKLTPFMKVLLGRTDRGRAIVAAVEGLDLQDLSRAKDAQIKAVTDLVWETKGLFYTLITGKASDVLGGLDVGVASKTVRVADLTASIPRDVVIAAQQQWLPNLGTEMAVRLGKAPPVAAAPVAAPPATASPPVTATAAIPEPSPPPAPPAASEPAKAAAPPAAAPPAAGPAAAPTETAARSPANPQDCVVRVFGSCLAYKAAGDSGSSALPPPSRLSGPISLPPASRPPVGRPAARGRTVGRRPRPGDAAPLLHRRSAVPDGRGTARDQAGQKRRPFEQGRPRSARRHGPRRAGRSGCCTGRRHGPPEPCRTRRSQHRDEPRWRDLG
jgi:hypothetical protein